MVGISEVVGMEGDLITLQELFIFQQTGLDENRKVKGRFKATGVRPKFAEEAHDQGIEPAPEPFRAGDVVRNVTLSEAGRAVRWAVAVGSAVLAAGMVAVLRLPPLQVRDRPRSARCG